jgi:GDP-mannose transporter
MKLTRPADVASHEVELQSLISEENADGIGDGSEEVSTPTAKHSKPEKPFRSSLFGIAACALYTFCSVTMVLSNKAISTSVDVEDKNRLPQMSIVMFQCLFAVVLVEFAKFWKVVEYGNFELKTAKQWLPLNVLFVGMLCTGFMSLVYVSVPMVTIFKNITNLFTVFGDWYIFGESISYLTITSVLIMTFGAIFAGIEDLEFNATGYFFMSLNCLCTAGYTLYMKYASSTIKLPK